MRSFAFRPLTRIQYAFRHDLLDPVMYRMGILAAIRSKSHGGKAIGVMVTASHNPEQVFHPTFICTAIATSCIRDANTMHQGQWCETYGAVGRDVALCMGSVRDETGQRQQRGPRKDVQRNLRQRRHRHGPEGKSHCCARYQVPFSFLFLETC